jgi:hypothetical protein
MWQLENAVGKFDRWSMLLMKVVERFMFTARGTVFVVASAMNAMTSAAEAARIAGEPGAVGVPSDMPPGVAGGGRLRNIKRRWG